MEINENNIIDVFFAIYEVFEFYLREIVLFIVVTTPMKVNFVIQTV